MLTQADDNFSRDVMTGPRHQNQRHATAVREGIRASVQISRDICTLAPRLLSDILNHLVFIAI